MKSTLDSGGGERVRFLVFPWALRFAVSASAALAGASLRDGLLGGPPVFSGVVATEEDGVAGKD